MPTSCGRTRASSTARSSASNCGVSSRSPSPPMRLAPGSPSEVAGASLTLAPAKRGMSKGACGPLGPPQGQLRAERQRTPVVFAIATAALVLATVLTRLPFMTRTLYAFDSANYALAVRDFYNVAFHQPHPPGYPLYVLFARAIDLAVHDANRSLVLEGIAWSAVGVACTIALARSLFGRPTGLLAGLLLVCTVGFWGYGEGAYPYVALAGETAALAVMVAWAMPMIALSGGWDVYRQVLADYLRVWSPQSAYVVGDFASGGDTLA